MKVDWIGPLVQLQTLPEEQKEDPWYHTINTGYAWIAGFRPYDYWLNTTNCFDRMTNLTYIEYPAWRAVLDDDSISDYDKMEYSLEKVSNISVHAWYCSAAWQSSNEFMYEHSLKFTSFGHFLLSMLQNFLGQVISLTNLYLSLE